MQVKNNNNISRRWFITGSLGAMGLLTILSSPFVSVLNRAKAAATTHEGNSSDDHAWCMVIDLKKCDGCTGLGIAPQCTQSCILGHYGPKGQKWIEIYEVEMAGGGSSFMPTPCYQCENAPCVNVCPVAATYHDKSGVVLIDHNRCIGCRMCMAACPFQRRFFNWATPELPPEAADAEYSPIYPVPAVKGTVIKCMFCAHHLVEGRLPYCVVACPRNVLYMGDLNTDVASNGQEVVQLSSFLDANNAYRYKESLGTQPRVFYLPGHGEASGRKPDDPRELIPNTWAWGNEGFDWHPGVWPWQRPSDWVWEEQPR
ncbi:MAG: 4Fe-4S dicluster domain-containing protein [Dehalococcoidales bacterium]|nr:4Fe-4S dicluster domain-containing protein [Dehalococcoidales bacterium]